MRRDGWKNPRSGISLAFLLELQLDSFLFFFFFMNCEIFIPVGCISWSQIMNLHFTYWCSVTCWFAWNIRWMLENCYGLPRGRFLLPSQLILSLSCPLMQLNPKAGNRFGRLKYNWDEAGERRDGTLFEEQNCFKNTLKKSVIMEMFLYFFLKFQFPIPDPSVCDTIYRYPLQNEHGLGWGWGDMFLFQVE